MVSEVVSTADLVAAFEARLEALPATAPDDAFVIVDRLSLWDGVSLRKAHRAVYVEVPDSADNGGRGHGVVFVRDTVRVVLLFSINPRDQKTSQTRALQVEDAVRAWLVERSWGAPYDVTHTRTRRGPAPRPALGFYEVALEFSTARAVLGSDPAI